MFQSNDDVTTCKMKISRNLPLFQGLKIFIDYNKEMRTSDSGHKGSSSSTISASWEKMCLCLFWDINL